MYYTQIFRHNHLSKIYWFLGAYLVYYEFTSSPRTFSSFALGIFALFFIYMIVKTLTFKIQVNGDEITQSSIFSSKTIKIRPHSKIYIKKHRVRLQFVFMIYLYKIKIVTGNDTLVLKANVMNADILYEIIQELEQGIVASKMMEYMDRHRKLQVDDNFLLLPDSVVFKGKKYEFNSMDYIEVEDWNLVAKKEGMLRDSRTMVIPLYDIPNIYGSMAIISKESGIII